MSSHPEKILVLGAGELGISILKALANSRGSSNDLTVLLRASTIASNSSEKQEQVALIRRLGITIQPGDLIASSESELAQIFKPFHTVISATGFVAGPGTQIKLARAVLSAGIPRYFPWQFGVDYDTIGKGSGQDLFDEQLDVRALLRAQTRTEWVIISTGVFTSFVFSRFFGVVDLDNAKVHALGDMNNRITVTTVEDIGQLTAEIVRAQPGIKNTVVFLAGDTISYSQLADIVQMLPSMRNREVRRDVWDVPYLRRRLRGEPDNTVRKYHVVFANGRGIAWDEECTYNGQHGISITTATEWALQNLQ